MAYYRGVAGDFTTVHYNRNFILSVFTLTRFHCNNMHLHKHAQLIHVQEHYSPFVLSLPVLKSG